MNYNREIKPKSKENGSVLYLASRGIDIFQFGKKQIHRTVPYLPGLDLKHAAAKTSLVVPEKHEKVIG